MPVNSAERQFDDAATGAGGRDAAEGVSAVVAAAWLPAVRISSAEPGATVLLRSGCVLRVASVVRCELRPAIEQRRVIAEDAGDRYCIERGEFESCNAGLAEFLERLTVTDCRQCSP